MFIIGGKLKVVFSIMVVKIVNKNRYKICSVLCFNLIFLLIVLGCLLLMNNDIIVVGMI